MKLRGHFCLAAAGALALPAMAQQLHLSDLVTEAVEKNPEIIAAQKQYEAARLRPDQASSLPETTFSAGYWSNGRPWPGAGLGREPTSNIGFAVSQEFPFPGKRKLRGDVAAKEAEVEFQEFQGVRLGVVSRLKQAYFRLAHSYLVVDVLSRNKELLTGLLRITEIRYSVGKAAQQDIFKAQTQLSILEARLALQRREQAAREAELLAILNRPPADALAGKPPALQPSSPAKTLEELFSAASRNSPLLNRGQKTIERNQLATNLARKDFYPDYTVSGGYFNQGRLADMYQFQVSFKLPTSYSRKQRAAVAEQVALTTQARRAREADSQGLAFRIKDEYLTWETSFRLTKLYGETVVPQSSLGLQSSLASYETGAVDFLSVLTNFISILEYEMNYHEEMLSGHLAAARLEELTGLPLAGEELHK